MAKKSEKKRRLALTAAGLSLFCCLALYLVWGFTYVGNHILPVLGFNLDQRASGKAVLYILLGGSITGAVLIYAAIITWLLVAKLFFTRAEVEAIAHFGPTTRFDRWLINKIFPITQ